MLGLSRDKNLFSTTIKPVAESTAPTALSVAPATAVATTAAPVVVTQSAAAANGGQDNFLGTLLNIFIQETLASPGGTTGPNKPPGGVPVNDPIINLSPAKPQRNDGEFDILFT
jgi:hypothetical protein